MSMNAFGAFETPFPSTTPAALEVKAEPINPFASSTTTESPIVSNIFTDLNVSTEQPASENTSSENPEVATGTAEGEKEKVKRVLAPRLDKEQKKFVLTNYATLGAEGVASKLAVNESQVRNVISQLRKDVQKQIDACTDEESKAKYESFLTKFLPKRVVIEGAAPTTRRERKSDNLSILDELISGLML